MHVSFDLHLIDSPHHALPANALPSDETMVKGNGRVKASYHQRKNHISLPVPNPITGMIKKPDGPRLFEIRIRETAIDLDFFDLHLNILTHVVAHDRKGKKNAIHRPIVCGDLLGGHGSHGARGGGNRF